MNNNEYLINFITQKVDEVWNKDYQCVAANKHHARMVFGIKLGWFNGFAIAATYKAGWTYDPKFWDYLIPWPWTNLKQWDHLIQKFGKTGHIWRVWRADDKWYFLVGQNDGEYDKDRKEKRGNGDGAWNDAILPRYYYRDERPIAYIFRRKQI